MAGPEDEIDGTPGQMSAANMVGPALMDPVADLVPGMAEGRAFVAKDGPATERMTKFMQDTNIGFDAYTNTARDAGHDYLASDEAGAARMNDVTRNIYA
jgi:hypothetical protein